MEISVVIPMYNAENTIAKSLESVLNQTYKEKIEVLIVNDGSKDSSRMIVEKFIENNNSEVIIKLINKENGGVSSARNLGLQNATGFYIALLDSDDEWLSNKLERQIEILKNNSEVDFLGCSRNDEQLSIFGKVIKTLHKANVKELLIKMFPQTSTAIFKRELYLNIGGYNENLTHAEDGELWIRFCAKANFYYLPESLVRTGGGKPSFGHSGLSANLEAMQRGNEFIFREARNNKLIGLNFFIFLMVYSKVKYLRRILITKFR